MPRYIASFLKTIACRHLHGSCSTLAAIISGLLVENPYTKECSLKPAAPETINSGSTATLWQTLTLLCQMEGYSSPKMPFEPFGHSVTSTMEQSCRLIAVGYLNKEVIFAQKQSKPHDLHCSIVLTLHFKAVLVS